MAAGRKTGGGSRKGIPNKATARVRDAIALLVEEKVDDLKKWLDEIYEKDGPKAAFQCFTELIEYQIPKLARTELAGAEDSKPLPMINVRFVTPEEARAEREAERLLQSDTRS